jgi:hypothetical protein
MKNSLDLELSALVCYAFAVSKMGRLAHMPCRFGAVEQHSQECVLSVCCDRMVELI